MGDENKEPSLSTLLAEIRDVKAIVTATQEGLTGVCARVDKIESEVELLKKEVAWLREEKEGMQRDAKRKEENDQRKEKYSRRKNVIISGIPQTEDEDTDAIVTELAQSLGIILRPFDLVVSHRLPTNEGVPDIIAQFFTVKTKFDIVKRAKKVKLQLLGVPIYVSEHLIQPTKFLLKAAKQLKKGKQIQFVWTANGDLFVRKAEGELAIKVESLADLERLGWKQQDPALRPVSAVPTLVQTPKRNMDQRSPENQQHLNNMQFNNKRQNRGGAHGGNAAKKNVFSGIVGGQSGPGNRGALSRGPAPLVAGGALSQALSQNLSGS